MNEVESTAQPIEGLTFLVLGSILVAVVLGVVGFIQSRPKRMDYAGMGCTQDVRYGTRRVYWGETPVIVDLTTTEVYECEAGVVHVRGK